MRAAQRGDTRVLEILIAYGANTKLENEGVSASSLAAGRGDTEIVKMVAKGQ